MRFSFRSKLMTIVGVAAVAFLLIIVAGSIISARAERQLATIRDHYLPRVELAPQLEAQLERIGRSFQDAVAAHDEEALAATKDLKRRFVDDLGKAGSAVEPADAASLRRALDAYFAAAHDVSRRLMAGETGEALLTAIAGMQAKQVEVAKQIKVAAAFDRSELVEAFTAVERSERVAGSYRLAISLACLASVVVLSLLLSRNALRAMENLAAGFARFGRGDFTEAIEVKSGDELGDVGREANRMARSLELLGKAQRKAEERFRALLEAAPDAMVIADDRGRVVLVNAQTERLFGRSRDELLDGSVEALVPERLHADELALFMKPPPGATSAVREGFGLRRDGAEFPIEISVSPLETEDGPVVSSAIRDVTERKRIETALRHSNRELEAFSYSVAHDLRAPLRGINGLSRALLEDFGEKVDAEGRSYLQRIAAGAERMGHLIDGLLALSRVSRTELQREEVDLSRMADGIVRQLGSVDPDRIVEFKNQEGATASGDPRLVRALLENLLGNAWKFTGARGDGRIEFGVVQQNGASVYFVRDNGAGFDMAYADKLFTPFQRLHSTAEFAGTGIGLATVQRIVERHGGRVWAKSAVGEGATFHFTLAALAGGKS